MAFEMIERMRYYHCESGDVKKTTGIEEGSILHETDTSFLYIFDGSNWQKKFNDSNVNYRSTTSSSGSGVVTVDVTSGGTTIVAANSNRLRIVIQNTGIEPVLLKFDGNPSTTDYDLILGGDSGVRIGEGTVFQSETWKGAIKGITEELSTVISVFEEEIT
jgi:hypothetical protein